MERGEKLTLKIGILGLGYVGIQLATAFGRNHETIGFDPNETKLKAYRSGIDPSGQVPSTQFQSATSLSVTSKKNDLKGCHIYVVAVPTPVDHEQQPDFGPLIDASRTVGEVIERGAIVVYESTVYPGATEEICVPVLEEVSGFQWKIDFHLGYSPERINPGDKEHTFTNIVKVVSGSTAEVLEIVSKTYASVVMAGVHQAPCIKVAEAAKAIENAQRDLNIAFVNELAKIFNLLGIKTHEVLEVAGSKWNFLPFQPGLVGGHCIGVDPYYLTYRVERTGYHPQVILAGRRINDEMGTFVAHQTVKTMASAGIGTVGKQVIVLGLTFKEDCADLRNSQVPDIIMELRSYGCEVLVHDPFCDPEEAQEEFGIQLTPNENLPRASAVILAVAHKMYRDWIPQEWLKLLLTQGVVTDVKNVVPAKQLEESGYLVWKL